jgi:hypothetical protein
MGGHPYWYIVAYDPDLEAVLERLREREFRAGRYNPVMPWIDFPNTRIRRVRERNIHRSKKQCWRPAPTAHDRFWMSWRFRTTQACVRRVRFARTCWNASLARRDRAGRQSKGTWTFWSTSNAERRYTSCCMTKISRCRCCLPDIRLIERGWSGRVLGTKNLRSPWRTCRSDLPRAGWKGPEL